MNMKIVNVKVIPNAKNEKVLEEDGKLKVYVRASATEGKANKALIEALADFFKVKTGDIRILRGLKSREKTVEVSQN